MVSCGLIQKSLTATEKEGRRYCSMNLPLMVPGFQFYHHVFIFNSLYLTLKFHLKFKIFHSRKCLWKCRLQNAGHCVSALRKHGKRVSELGLNVSNTSGFPLPPTYSCLSFLPFTSRTNIITQVGHTLQVDGGGVGRSLRLVPRQRARGEGGGASLAGRTVYNLDLDGQCLLCGSWGEEARSVAMTSDNHYDVISMA